MKLGRCEGGCWFCEEDDEKEPLVDTFEFDAMVHKSCAVQAEAEGNPEGRIIMDEIRAAEK